ncbi:MAG: LysR substrate-binding domain-containing protein [Pseudomonadota bacterium]
MLSRLPLEVFRVFEAAARHGNFSAAARELGVTQAAVSRRIRGLEDQLGAALFERRGRHVALTPAGRQLHERTRAALDYLEEALAPFVPGAAPRTVSIVASGSVSHLWLGPHLRAFARDHPSVSVRLTTSDAMEDLADDAHDLTILYSAGTHPRWRLAPLIAEELVPVASPAFIAEAGVQPPLAADAIRNLPLIDYDRVNAHWIPPAAWFEAEAAPLPPDKPRVIFTSYLPAVEAAVRGDGITLGSLGLISGHIAAGRLVALSENVMRTGKGYYLGLPQHRAVSEEALALHRLLLQTGSDH